MKQFRDSRYWVSEDGKVFKYTPERTYVYKRWYKDHYNEYPKIIPENYRQLKPTLRNNGYLVFNLQCPSLTCKGYFNTSVHRMVAECYIGPCPEGMEVDHIDGDKTNNHISNLQYLTPEENLAKNPKGWYL